MEYSEKVDIFSQELLAAESTRAAIIGAHKRGLNAAWCEDEEAFKEALERVGRPEERFR